ncbi:hypothetical protein Hdeb2414_s0007g00240131 [Helianthus debilis subsp. tardiflorus]
MKGDHYKIIGRHFPPICHSISLSQSQISLLLPKNSLTISNPNFTPTALQQSLSHHPPNTT